MEPDAQSDRDATAQSLVALGAPLAGWRPSLRLPPEQAVLNGLDWARENATLLRAMPVVLARQWSTLDWSHMEAAARTRGVLPLLGMLLELTAWVANLPQARARAQSWWTPPRALQLLFGSGNDFERELAEHRTPPLARKWGFLMNVGQDSFESLYRRHAG